MTDVLLDTRSWVWSIKADSRLSEVARTAIRQAGTVWVSAISVYEIGQKVRLGKWPEMAGSLASLPGLLTGRSGREIAPTADISLVASTMEWDHRDPFDRIIAATALALDVPLISADVVFDGLKPPSIRRIW